MGTRLAARTLSSPAARRPVAALWFAAIGALTTFLFFLRLTMAAHAVILYVLLPSLAAGIAGCLWGYAILDSSRVRTSGAAVLRGLVIGAMTYVLFAALYAVVLPMLEGPWSLGRVGGLFLLTLLLGILMGGPLSAIAGIFGGITLYGIGHLVFADRGERPSGLTGDEVTRRSG